MKKSILMFCLLATSAITVNAQKLHVYAKAGANFTKIDGKEFNDEYKTGFHVGGAVEIGISKSISLQPELYYSELKTISINSVITPGFNVNNEVKLNYLSIPLLLKINATKVLSLHVGPEYSILVNNDEDLLTNGKEAFKSGNFSMIGGVQINLSNINIYGRYNVGLSSIEDAPSTDKWKSQQIQVGIAFKVL
ncbi:MAG: porin family protein [Chitinophagaceae bacterium]|jgi:opacity protein-like surface antigen